MGPSSSGVIAFALLASLLLLGTVLRARIGWLARALVPASLIGGVIGFALVATGLAWGFEAADFAPFTFHFFTLSFMSLCLTGAGPRAGGSVAWGGMWLSVIWVMSLVLQALVGLAVIAGYNAVTGNSLSEFLGIMVTHGFTQGPGQAVAFGSIWQNAFGIDHALGFGLIYAAVGFIVAFAVGVPVARAAVRRGINANRSARMGEEFLKGIYSAATRESTGRQITHPANVDTLAYHIAILGVAYLVTEAWMRFMQPIAAGIQFEHVNLGVIFSPGLFFFHGLVVCVILRALMDRFGLGRFIDDDTQRRITGSSVDLMVVATLMSIEFTLLAEFIVPITLVCLAVALVTAALCFGYGRRLGDLGIERALASFGCCTGTTGSGILLLRILDPDLGTPIARELAFFNVAIVFLAFHVLTVMVPILPVFELGTIVAVYSATFAAGAMAIVWIVRRIEAEGALERTRERGA